MKLSEIGREMSLESKFYIDAEDRSYSFARLFCPVGGKVPPSVTETVVPAHIYSPEERRQFARECIERYLQRLHEIHAFTSAPSIDEFLDGEGI